MFSRLLPRSRLPSRTSRITPFLEQTGRTEAAEEADVRARVRGFLQEVNFQPGEPVTQESILYKVEPDQYQAAFQSAEAAVEAAKADILVKEARLDTLEAEVTRADLELTRQKKLQASNASSQAQLQTAEAANAAAIANQNSGKADIAAAKANLNSAEAKRDQALVSITRKSMLRSMVRLPRPISKRATSLRTVTAWLRLSMTKPSLPTSVSVTVIYWSS